MSLFIIFLVCFAVIFCFYGFASYLLDRAFNWKAAFCAALAVSVWEVVKALSFK
jgi:hypothetical protein